MSMNILDLKTRLEQKIHDLSIDKVSDFYGLVKEAAGNVLLKIDPQETKRFAAVENALYDQVYSYVLPSDVKGNKIFSLRPQVNNNPANRFSQTYSGEFDLYKTNDTSAIEFNNGVKILRVSKSLRAGPVVNEANDLTSNGTWSAGGDASNLRQDTVNFVTGGASLIFDLAASGSAGYLENSTMTPVDLTVYENTGRIFVWVYIPDSDAITSIGIRLGSSSSNYIGRSATTAVASTAFVDGWNLIPFDWSGATEVGTVDPSSISYLRITYNYDGTAVPSCRLDSTVVRLGTIYELGYYSKFLFRTSAGTWIEEPTSDDDLINLDTESFNVLLYEVALLVVQELSGENAKFDIEYFKGKRDEVWNAYMESYKSESMKPRVDYYRRRMMRRR